MDNNNSNSDHSDKNLNPSAPVKIKKKKGPIRWEAIVPTTIIFLALGLYGHFFFDHHLKVALELIGSYTYGAEVNIKKIESSLFKAKLDIISTQVTEIDHPQRNIIEVERIGFQLNTDALLKARLVVTSANIDGIALHSPRKSPGKIYRSKSQTKEAAKEAESRIVKNVKTQIEGNILGDISNTLSATDPKAQLKDFRDELATQRKIKEIQNRLQEKEAFWKKRIAELPNKEKFQSYEIQLRSLKFNTKEPASFASDIKEAQAIIKSAEQELKLVKSDTQKLTQDLKGFEDTLTEIEAAKQEDLKTLQNKLQIPQLDTKSLALALFGPQVQKYVDQFNQYSSLFKEYFPPETAEEKATKKKTTHSVTPKERALGKTYEFPTTKSYPLFWLQKASISSNSKKSSYSGDLKGTVTHLTSNPKLLKKPAQIKFSGNFPHQDIKGVQAEITLDRTGDTTENSIKASVNSFPVKEQSLSQSEKVKFAINKASGSSQVNGTLKSRNLDLKIETQFSNASYSVEAKSQLLSQVLQRVAKDTPNVSLTTQVQGPLSSPSLSISTNLAQAIQSSIKSLLNEKITEAKKEIKNFVENRIKEEKDKLTSQLDGFKNGPLKDIANLNNSAESAQSNLEKKLSDAKSSQAKGVEEKAKKEIKNLLKNFNF